MMQATTLEALFSLSHNLRVFCHSEDEILEMVREVSDDKKNDSLEFNEFLKVEEIAWITSKYEYPRERLIILMAAFRVKLNDISDSDGSFQSLEKDVISILRSIYSFIFL